MRLDCSDPFVSAGPGQGKGQQVQGGPAVKPVDEGTAEIAGGITGGIAKKGNREGIESE